MNLALALLISIPAINYFTHGTHITVAHAMGTTIGINTTILLASVFYIFNRMGWKPADREPGKFQGPFLTFNISLLFFLFSLVMAGIGRSIWQHQHPEIRFAGMHEALRPWFILMTASGTGIIAGLYWMIFHLAIVRKQVQKNQLRPMTGNKNPAV